VLTVVSKGGVEDDTTPPSKEYGDNEFGAFFGPTEAGGVNVRKRGCCLSDADESADANENEVDKGTTGCWRL